MTASVSDLLSALPEDFDVPDNSEPDRVLDDVLEQLSRKPVPTGALRRFGALTGLHAKIGLAYMAWWVRNAFRDAEKRQQALMETNLKSALKIVSTMGYLRGAVMKIGQAAASFPDIVPDEFVSTLSRLHFEAPPMHWSLIREVLHDELGQDPETVFASFDRQAVAAASLGQVHRATLKSGEEVAIKVQYPGIARTIRSDFRNLSVLMLPLRMTRSWANIQSQLEEVRSVLEKETDYVQEAEYLRKARQLFREEDRIVVPRVFEGYSSRRVLTMEYLDGKSLPDYLKSDPPQDERNHFGSLIIRAQCRMIYAGRMQYADPHPGNYLILPDGYLGAVDFGCMREYSDDDWDYLRGAHAAVVGGREEAEAHMRRGTEFTEKELADPELMDTMIRYADWLWQAMRQEEAFDYGDADVMREGIAIIREFSKRWRPAQKAVNVFIQRSTLCGWGIQHMLRSQVLAKKICDEEVLATGWFPQSA